MAVSGVRSSWLASAMKRRMRSSDWTAASSDSCRSWKADSIWVSMALIERPSRPTSVRGSRSGTRRSRWPAAMSSAVSSMSSSGRRLLRTTAMPTMASTMITTMLTIRSTRTRSAMVVKM